MKNTTVITLNTNIQLFDINRSKNSSFLTLIILLANTIVSDTESTIDSNIEGDFDKTVNNSELLSALLATESKVINYSKFAK